MPSDRDNAANKSWTPAVPVKRQDNIISSDYARTTKVFVPSYEIRECRPCMDHLIANEYQRIWWEERNAWDRSHLDRRRGKCLSDSGVSKKAGKPVIKALQIPNATFRDNKAYTIRMKQKELKKEETMSSLHAGKSGSTSKKSAKS